MKYDEAISYRNLLNALKKCTRGTLWKESTAGYWLNRLKNTYILHEELLNGKYRISKYLWFTITEPKEREIFASYIKDRQHQHAFIDNVVLPEMSKHFIAENCACQKGKGTKYCIDMLLKAVRKYTRVNGNNGYVLKGDIKKFFPSTNHKIACEEIALYVDTKTARACQDVINSFSEMPLTKSLMETGMDKQKAQTIGHSISNRLIYGGDYSKSLKGLNEKQISILKDKIQKNDFCGVGLGSQVTQTTQIALLNRLDHFIVEQLKASVYIRYMDDFILISESKEHLKNCLILITEELRKLKLELNAKTQLFPITQGFKLLHWHIMVTTNGKVYIRKDKIKLNREQRKLRKQKKLLNEGRISIEQIEISYQCWQSCILQQKCYWQVIRMRRFYYYLFKRRAPEWNLKKRLWKKAEKERLTIITEAKKKMC